MWVGRTGIRDLDLGVLCNGRTGSGDLNLLDGRNG